MRLSIAILAILFDLYLASRLFLWYAEQRTRQDPDWTNKIGERLARPIMTRRVMRRRQIIRQTKHDLVVGSPATQIVLTKRLNLVKPFLLTNRNIERGIWGDNIDVRRRFAK